MILRAITVITLSTSPDSAQFSPKFLANLYITSERIKHQNSSETFLSCLCPSSCIQQKLLLIAFVSNAMESARRLLAEKVGVRPSDHWWSDCWGALSLERNNLPQADDVLEQILHHDLRDVVRTFDGGDNIHEVHEDEEFLPSVMLRQALRQSQQAAHNFQAQLPASFALLVQMEEVLDISANAMTRLEYGPTNSNTDPAPVGNSAKRCLKIGYSDGYSVSGHAFYNENQPPEILVAMEVQPIPDLSVHSRAGLKVLVKGPVTIRRGVSFWHAGNVTVIGGHVAALVEIQVSALQQAKQLAGVGVDPTVRALIGTQPLETEEENNDEGEHESGDVAAPPPAPPVPSMPVPQPVVAHQRPTPTPVAATRQPTPPQSGNPYASSNIAATTNPYGSTHDNGPDRNNANPYTTNHRTTTSRSMSPPLPRNSSNPYATNHANNSESSLPSIIGNPYSANRSHQSTTLSPPRSRIAVSTGMLHGSSGCSSITSATTTTTNLDRQTRNPHESINNTSHPTARSSSTPANVFVQSQTKASAPRLAPEQPGSPDVIMVVDDEETLSVSNDNQAEPMEVEPVIEPANSTSSVPFTEVLHTVQTLVESTPEAYQQAVSQKEWIIELIVSGSRVDFNVVGKKKAGSKKKVYEYMLLYKFVGETPSQPVTCQIDTAFVQKFLGYSPPDLRNLRKTRAPEANQICKEGGHKILAHIGTPRTYRVTLAEIPDEYFQKEERPLDGNQPILYLREM